jgi:hypothetical protein
MCTKGCKWLFGRDAVQGVSSLYTFPMVETDMSNNPTIFSPSLYRVSQYGRSFSFRKFKYLLIGAWCMANGENSDTRRHSEE